MKLDMRKYFVQSEPAQQCAVLAVVMAAALVLAVPIGLAFAGASGACAAVAAAMSVLIASIISLCVAALFPSNESALWRLLFSMTVRMSIPMSACLIVLMIGGPLAKGGFVYFVLAFYLVALPVDTLLAMSHIEQKSDAPL
jgi:hypothetical protein